MPPKNYSIVSQTQRPKLDASNRLIHVYIITLQTAMGGVGTVEIPVDLFEQMEDADLRGIFEEKARQLDRAYTL